MLWNSISNLIYRWVNVTWIISIGQLFNWLCESNWDWDPQSNRLIDSAGRNKPSEFSLEIISTDFFAGCNPSLLIVRFAGSRVKAEIEINVSVRMTLSISSYTITSFSWNPADDHQGESINGKGIGENKRIKSHQPWANEVANTNGACQCATRFELIKRLMDSFNDQLYPIRRL